MIIINTLDREDYHAASVTGAPTAPSFASQSNDNYQATISTASRLFKDNFFPDASDTDWNDSRWQSRNRIRTGQELRRIFELSADEEIAVRRYEAHLDGGLPFGITPYYASLMSRSDPSEPLRRTHIPVAAEFEVGASEADDPLGEDHDTAAQGVVHRYPDRVLFLVTGTCSTYCRYCTRSRMVGQPGGEYSFSRTQMEAGISYIARHPEIRDVLISGGDPLTFSDAKLDWLLSAIRTIPHVEFIRIGTKVPFVLPMRVTPGLLGVFRKHRLDMMSIHATHPNELAPETTQALMQLADAGVPLGSQTVLLKGVNDNVEVMKRLMHGLLKCHVRPYYLYACDPVSGSAHFRTSVAKGIEIIEGLRGHTTGYAVPTYVIDAPDGGGKIPLLPSSKIERQGDRIALKNFEGKTFYYPDPTGKEG